MTFCAAGRDGERSRASDKEGAWSFKRKRVIGRGDSTRMADDAEAFDAGGIFRGTEATVLAAGFGPISDTQQRSRANR